MTADFDEAAALEKFDHLRELGLIHYGSSSTVQLRDEGFLVGHRGQTSSVGVLTSILQFEFRICPSWANKPMTVDAKIDTGDHQHKLETFGPDSDIIKAHTDQIITIINDTHILALNAYPVFRPQYLLLTQDSYRLQDEPLDMDDVAAVAKVLFSVSDPHYVLYNCTTTSGCSRKHKHMQVLKKPGVGESHVASPFRFFPDTQDSNFHVPYQYDIHYFNSSAPFEVAAVYEIYLDMLCKCRKRLGLQEADTDSLCPHNLVFTTEWMILIPRRSNDYNGVGANATAMMGIPMMSDREILQIWLENGPARVLKELGVPRKLTEK